MNQRSKRRISVVGVFLLFLALTAGFLYGSLSECNRIQAEKSTYESAAAAGKKNYQKTGTSTEKNNGKKGDSVAEDPDMEEIEVQEDGTYTSKEEVAAYLHEFECLPSNYLTKKEAEKLGWDNRKGNLDEVAPGKSIGGDKFGNYEELLPTKKGRKYFECDIDYEGGYRGAKRIIYSNDGLIFYTEDHYKTFEQLY